jgi:hypothetical protein
MRLVAAITLATALWAGDGDKAQFTKDGALVRPQNYREWVFLSSGLGMTYGPNAPAAGSPLRFDNVFVNPSSYREFLRTGTWPDGTVLILEIRESQSKGSINQHGNYQTGIVAIEANVRDSRRYAGKNWAFFDLTPKPGQETARPIPPGNRCEQCHSTNGAVDSTFVQFYPELIPVAKKFGTFRQSTAAQ